MKKPILVLVLFALLTGLMTFPLVFKINTHIPGFFSTDEPSLWGLWWLRVSAHNGINANFCPLIAAPFGVDLSIIGIVFPLSTLLKKLVVMFTTEAFTYNIEILLSFLLSGFFVYLLIDYAANSKPAAILGGIIYAFCPYHFARAWQHIGLSDIQWMPLYIFALLKLREKNSYRNILFASLALFLVASFEFYYLYFMIIVTVFFVIFSCAYYRRASFKFIPQVLLSNCLTAVILTLLIYPAFSMGLFKVDKGIAPDAWAFIRPFGDLFSQSARPLSYILPSTEHPVFGNFTRNFVGTMIYGESFTEHALFLGFLPMFLAFWALINWKKKGEEGEGFNFRFFAWLLLVSWLFSQPPWWNIFGIKLYMPSFFMYKIIPLFRAYCRFGIVVMFAVAVLAGFGLKFILSGFRSQRTKNVITGIACALILFEFWNYPPYKIIDVSKFPQAYHWLKEQPGDFTIAEYPLDADSPNERYRFYQTKHNKKMINFTGPGTYANRVARTITKLSEPDTCGILKWLGVRFVLVHKMDYTNSGLMVNLKELEDIQKNPDLKFVKSFENIDVYEVTASPREPGIKDEK